MHNIIIVPCSYFGGYNELPESERIINIGNQEEFVEIFLQPQLANIHAGLIISGSKFRRQFRIPLILAETFYQNVIQIVKV